MINGLRVRPRPFLSGALVGEAEARRVGVEGPLVTSARGEEEVRARFDDEEGGVEADLRLRGEGEGVRFSFETSGGASGGLQSAPQARKQSPLERRRRRQPAQEMPLASDKVSRWLRYGGHVDAEGRRRRVLALRL